MRSWEEDNLPLSQSRIAYDLLIFLANCHYSDQPPTLKTIFNSLQYSERGIRYVLDQFICSNWCEIVVSEDDRRFRHVILKKKLTDAFESYEYQFSSNFHEYEKISALENTIDSI